MNIKVLGYELDEQQQRIVTETNKNVLVIAGAGSGKTLTILGKIKYLVKIKNIDPSQILCITFTNTAVKSIKEKLEKEQISSVPCYTFHKLALELLKEHNSMYNLTETDTLEHIVHKFFHIDALENELLMRLILKYFNQIKLKNVKEKYIQFLQKKAKEVENLQKLIITFLHLFKCNNYRLEDFITFKKTCKRTIHYFTYQKEKQFLIFALNIYLRYQSYLEENKEIDFDDLIIKATEVVNNKGTIKKLKYIIIDEYQDTSFIRFLLIKELLIKTNANLMVVGDDFQSIYSFSGCDLSLFLDFKKFFPDAKQYKIETTYRNSQELITIAGNFVMKNKNQIKKYLVSKKHEETPIEIIYYKDIKQTIKKIIEEVSMREDKKIMILGRNNKDIDDILDKEWELKDKRKLIYKKRPTIEIEYLTIHKAKGLEKDTVIVINLKDNLLGIPIQIKEEQILRLVTTNYDKFPYSEERRLFYVALTRTKGKLYLLCPKRNYSIFIKEIRREKHVKCQKM